MKRVRLIQHLIPFFGDIPLSKMSSFDVERYKHQRRTETAVRGGDRQRPKDESKLGKTSSSTINRELAVLSHLLNKAVEWGWVEHRPLKINRYKEGSGRIVYLTVDQIGRVIDSAKLDPNPQIYPFILIGLETAMRRMEILSVRREHVDLERRVIYIPKAKAGAREQPITAHLAGFIAEYLRTLPEDSVWLFPARNGTTGHTVDIRKPYRRVVRAAGLDPDQIVRHTLRHTAITHLVQAGVDLPTVKRISGHKTLAMVERYAHANGTHIEAAMERLQTRLKIAS
jgi:integrase